MATSTSRPRTGTRTPSRSSSAGRATRPRRSSSIPSVRVGTGTVAATSMRLTLTWTAGDDDSGLAHFDIRRAVDGGIVHAPGDGGGRNALGHRRGGPRPSLRVHDRRRRSRRESQRAGDDGRGPPDPLRGGDRTRDVHRDVDPGDQPDQPRRRHEVLRADRGVDDVYGLGSGDRLGRPEGLADGPGQGLRRRGLQRDDQPVPGVVRVPPGRLPVRAGRPAGATRSSWSSWGRPAIPAWTWTA